MKNRITNRTLIRIIISLIFVGIIYYTTLVFKSRFIFFMILNPIGCFLCILLFINPTNLYYLATLGFMYSFAMVFFFPEEHCFIIFFTGGTMSLAILGIYHFHKKIKIFITSIIYFLMIFTELRFGIDVFLTYFYIKLIYTGAFIIVAVLCYMYFNQIIDRQQKKKLIIKDLNLSEKHIKVFYLITQNVKFETIAKKLNYSIPSVKRIARNIYKQLEVPDLICFNAKIGRYEIIYPENFIIPEI
ncbi:MAG: hypothetical protein IKX23_08425 [Treponema sp.]|nr:hypothetical protein [Treponema sp.]